MRWLGGIIDSMDIKLGDSGGQGSLMCCSPLGCKELDMTYGITTRVECSLCPHDSDLMKVQNVSQTAFWIALNERSGMLRYAPEKCHRRSSGGWLNFRRPTPCSLVPTWNPWTPTAAVARSFFLIWEDLAWTPALAIKPLPIPHTSQTPFVSSLTRPREFCPRATAQ